MFFIYTMLIKKTRLRHPAVLYTNQSVRKDVTWIIFRNIIFIFESQTQKAKHIENFPNILRFILLNESQILYYTLQNICVNPLFKNELKLYSFWAINNLVQTCFAKPNLFLFSCDHYRKNQNLGFRSSAGSTFSIAIMYSNIKWTFGTSVSFTVRWISNCVEFTRWYNFVF